MRDPRSEIRNIPVGFGRVHPIRTRAWKDVKVVPEPVWLGVLVDRSPMYTGSAVINWWLITARTKYDMILTWQVDRWRQRVCAKRGEWTRG